MQIAKAIVEYAVSQGVDYIVFEHLDFKKKKSSQKITIWRKKDIQNRVEHKAHKVGIRINRVNSRNTSKLAFDGSGYVTRGKQAGFKNNKLCKFSNNKIYNCDLNGSYNIGARFYLRELKKSYRVTDKSCAKVEILCNKSRLQWVLEDLKKVS